MTDPLWRSGEKASNKRARKLARKKLRAHFVVEYDLVYDGGGSRWNGYYKTYAGARIGACWNLHFQSWGGKAEIFTHPKPVPPPVRQHKKGLFRGRK